MSGYFSFVRTDIEPLLPPTASRIVDVGCGIGATSAWLKTRYPRARTVGLEGNGAVLEQLSANVDEARVVDLNGPAPDIGQADLILCLDVLEHLAAPEKLLSNLAAQLAPGGTVIVSLPNVAHLSVSLPLLLKARFDYADAGILDRTHLRFFVRGSAVDLLNGAGLRVEAGLRGGFTGPKSKLIDRLTFGAIRDHLTKQYILAGRPMNGSRQGRIRWRLAGGSVN
jgi:trans-aconitate methyltransferase